MLKAGGGGHKAELNALRWTRFASRLSHPHNTTTPPDRNSAFCFLQLYLIDRSSLRPFRYSILVCDLRE